jgi:hypothetical protein
MSSPCESVLGDIRTLTSPLLALSSSSALAALEARWWCTATLSLSSGGSPALSLLPSSSAFAMLRVKTSVRTGSSAYLLRTSTGSYSVPGTPIPRARAASITLKCDSLNFS